MEHLHVDLPQLLSLRSGSLLPKQSKISGDLFLYAKSIPYNNLTPVTSVIFETKA